MISGLLADRIGILNAYLLASAFAAIICWTTWLVRAYPLLCTDSGDA